MCLITCAPKGTLKTVDALKSFIKRGVESNRDGSGLMWKINGNKTVNFQKGYRKEEDILKKIESLNLGINDELIFHSRIGTSGLMNDENMHPFIVTDDKTILLKTSGRVSLPVMAHNGYFMDYSFTNSNYSDTFHFVLEFAGIPEIRALLIRDSKLFEELFKDSHIKRTKLAFLFPEKDMVMYGDFIKDDGYYHSHGGYREPVYNQFRNTVLAKNNEIDWESYYEEKYGPVDNKTLFSKSKPVASILPSMIQFTHQQMKITDLNFKDFYLVPIINSDKIEKGVMYEIEEFDEITDVLFLNSKRTKDIEMVDKNILDHCKIYVKDLNRKRYIGIDNLFKQIYQKKQVMPSRSMLKKMNEFLTNKKGYNFGTFKNYGTIYLADLRNYLDNFEKCVEETFVKGTNSSVGAQFSMNELALQHSKTDNFLRSLGLLQNKAKNFVELNKADNNIED